MSNTAFNIAKIGGDESDEDNRDEINAALSKTIIDHYDNEDEDDYSSDGSFSDSGDSGQHDMDKKPKSPEHDDDIFGRGYVPDISFDIRTSNSHKRQSRRTNIEHLSQILKLHELTPSELPTTIPDSFTYSDSNTLDRARRRGLAIGGAKFNHNSGTNSINDISGDFIDNNDDIEQYPSKLRNNKTAKQRRNRVIIEDNAHSGAGGPPDDSVTGSSVTTAIRKTRGRKPRVDENNVKMPTKKDIQTATKFLLRFIGEIPPDTFEKIANASTYMFPSKSSDTTITTTTHHDHTTTTTDETSTELTPILPDKLDIDKIIGITSEDSNSSSNNTTPTIDENLTAFLNETAIDAIRKIRMTDGSLGGLTNRQIILKIKKLQDEIIEQRRNSSKTSDKNITLRQNRISILIRILKDIGVHLTSEEEFLRVIIPRETLLDQENIFRMYSFVEELKLYYSSDMLNCLHSNALERQKSPGINMLRQLLNCNHYDLIPKAVSQGYEKGTGRKLVARFFHIQNMK